MRTKLLVLIIAVLSLLAGIAVRYALSGAGFQVAAESTGTAYDHPPLHDMDGQAVALQRWQGRKILLNFWASWCTPCREEMPLLSSTQAQSGDASLQIIGLALDDPEEVAAFLQETPVGYPILLGGNELPSWMEQLGNRATVLPFSVLFDEQGKMLSTFTGKLDKQSLETWMQTHDPQFRL